MFKLFFILITYLTAQNLYALDDNSYANGWYWGKDIHPEDEKNAKPQMVTKIVRPNNDFKGIPRKVICTCGARRLAIPRKESVINIAKIQGIASCVVISTTWLSMLSIIAIEGVSFEKKRGLMNLSGGRIS